MTVFMRSANASERAERRNSAREMGKRVSLLAASPLARTCSPTKPPASQATLESIRLECEYEIEYDYEDWSASARLSTTTKIGVRVRD